MNYQPQNIKSDGSVSPTNKKGPTTIDGGIHNQNNTNTLSTNSINDVQAQNIPNKAVPQHATSNTNLSEAKAQIVRQKRNRSNNASNLDNNMTSDITLQSPMGIFDDNIEETNDQSTSFDGVLSKSTMNRKDRRGFFHKKELQLHTTIRKGKTTGHNTYILSPDQVKFNQENLQQRFEEEDNDIILNLNNSSNMGKRRNNDPTANLSLHSEQ